MYRVVAEAVTNVVRHARASRCTVQLSLADWIILDINDGGPPNGVEAWSTGVRLTSMRERTAELAVTGWPVRPGVAAEFTPNFP